MEGSKLHLAILSSPGMGHLIPVLNLGKRLVTHHNADVTILVVTAQSSPAQSQLLSPPTASKNLHVIELPPVDISGLVDPGSQVVTQLAVMMREARPAVRTAISSMIHRPHVLIVDLFGTESLEIANEFDMSKYVYVPSTAWFVALSSYCQILDKKVKGQYVDQEEPLRIPGCKPVRPEDVVDPMLDRNDQQYREYVRQGIQFSAGDGILLNTWEDLERTSLKALRDDEIMRSVVKVPIYPIGPLIRPVEPADLRTEYLRDWLAMQPTESVLYVSFGSGGTMSAEQITELAWGLELSQQRFIWVVRPPIDGNADGSFFSAGNGPDGTPDYLPDGFLTRTHNLGIVVPLWAPQVEILSHRSIGGFLSHCGWNSSLESIVNGVPMIAWPLYAEQRLNATLLTEELGVAVRPKVLPTKKIVEREEIEKMVRTVMEYKEGKAMTMRERVKELKNSAEKTLSNGTGSSYNSMCEVIRVCKMRLSSSKAL